VGRLTTNNQQLTTGSSTDLDLTSWQRPGDLAWCILSWGLPHMKKLAATLMFCATALFADTAETVFFRGVMLPANEVPAVPIEGSSSALLAAHIVRDDSGKIISGTVDFSVDYNFTGAVTLTGL